MATRQTSSELGRSVEGYRRGFPRLVLKLDALAICLGVGAAGFGVVAARTGYPSAFVPTAALVLAALLSAWLDLGRNRTHRPSLDKPGGLGADYRGQGGRESDPREPTR